MLPTVFNSYWLESRKQQVNGVQKADPISKVRSIVYKYLDYEYEYEYRVLHLW